MWVDSEGANMEGQEETGDDEGEAELDTDGGGILFTGHAICL